MIAFLLRLYPARWRIRYGDEFEAMLSDRPLGPFDVADVLLGALDAHLHLRGLGAYPDHGKGIPMSLRLGGYAAIVGGILWFVGLALAQYTGGDQGIVLVLLGTTALLVALIGLSAFQARRHPRLTWAAFIIPAVGAVVSIVGMIGMSTPGDGPFIAGLSAWYVWSGGVIALLIGSGLFAIATWRVHALSRRAAALLGVGCAAIVPALVGAIGGPEPLGQVIFVGSILAFAGGWIALGVSAVRTDQMSAAAA